MALGVFSWVFRVFVEFVGVSGSRGLRVFYLNYSVSILGVSRFYVVLGCFGCFAWVIARYSVFFTCVRVIVEFFFVFVESRGFMDFGGGGCGLSGLLRGFSVSLVCLVGVWWIL